MKIDWHGRYHELVEALVRHSNVVHRSISSRIDFIPGAELNMIELELLEFIIANDDKRYNINRIAEILRMPQSSASKAAAHLVEKGLAERYRTEGNKKNIILLPSEKGCAAYFSYAETAASAIWKPFFSALDSLTDEQIDTFVTSLNLLSGYINSDTDEKLIKL